MSLLPIKPVLFESLSGDGVLEFNLEMFSKFLSLG